MNIPYELVKEFASGNGAIFVGSGLSIGAGLPGRKALIRELAREFEGEISDAPDEDIVQYYCDENGRRELVSQLRDTLNTFQVQPTVAHNALVKLPVEQIFTTNYDNLLEKALEQNQRQFNVVVENEEVGFIEKGNPQLFKLHGDLTRPKSVVLTNQDHALYFEDHKPLVTMFTVTLQTKIVLFVGYSAKDTHFRELLYRVRSETRGLSRNAFIILFNANKIVARQFEHQKIRVINLDVPYEQQLPEAQKQNLLNQTLADWLKEFHRQIETKQQAMQEQPRASAKSLPPEPYKFLDYFTHKDSAIFFGRGQETEKLVSLIQTYRLTILYGGSGTGKTSLLQAAVLPQLEEEKKYIVVYARPLGNPLSEVQEAMSIVFRNKLGREIQTTNLREMIEKGLPEGRQLLIVLDQFEEFFIRQGEETRAQFVQEFVTILGIASRDVRCLFSLRNDYLDRLDELELPLGKDPLLHRMRLYPLGSEAASAAITRPASAFKIPIDAALVERLLQDLKQIEIAPAQLQVVCYELWQDWNSRGKPESGMTLNCYLELGDTRTILTDYLDNVIQALNESDVRKKYGLKLDAETAQKTTRAVLKSMVTSEQTKVAVSMREITHHEILSKLDIEEEQAETLLKYLRNKRVIRRLPDSNQYELAHEVMVEKIWKWLDKEERYLLHLKDTLTSSMNDYRNLRTLLPLDRLNLITEQAAQLSIDHNELELLLRSAIQHSTDSTDTKFWVEKMESQNAIKILSELLEDSPRKLYPQIAEALGHTHSPRSLRYLTELLSDKSDRIQHAAAKALGNINVQAANQILYRAIWQETKLTRAAKIIEALERYKGDETVTNLTKIVSSHPNNHVCERAANALFRSDHFVGIKTLIEQLSSNKHAISKAAANALKGRTGEALDELAVMLESDNLQTRLTAVDALGAIGYGRTKELIKKALLDQNVLIREKSMTILWESGDETAIELILDQFSDSDISIQNASFRALSLLLHESISEELANKKIQERMQIIRILGKLNDKRVIKPLIMFLKDKNNEVRQQVIYELTNLSNLLGIESLIVYLQDKDSEIRLRTVQLLGQLDDEQVIKPLIACLQDQDTQVRIEAIHTLTQLGDEQIISPLIACLQDENSEIQWHAIYALKILVKDEKKLESLLQSEDGQIREYIIETFRQFNDEWIFETLADLQDKDRKVRRHAIIALGHLEDKRFVGPFIKCLQDEDSKVRRYAVIALGYLGDKRAIAPLTTCLHDEDSEVRWRAVIAL